MYMFTALDRTDQEPLLNFGTKAADAVVRVALAIVDGFFS